MKHVYDWVGVTKQAAYQHRSRQAGREAKEAVIIVQVQQIRQRHPRMGTRKLLEIMQPWLMATGVKIGRDYLFELLRRHGMLLNRPRRRQRRHQALKPRADVRARGR